MSLTTTKCHHLYLCLLYYLVTLIVTNIIKQEIDCSIIQNQSSKEQGFKYITYSILINIMGNKIISGGQAVDIALEHELVSNATLVTRFDRSVLRVVLPCDNETYKSWRAMSSKQQVPEHDNLLIPVKHEFKTTGMCSTRGQLEMQFPAYPYLLNSEIRQRRNKSMYFGQSQLWYLLFSLLSVKEYLDGVKGSLFQAVLGDIRPENVFISQNGFVKFVNVYSWPGEKSGYVKALEGGKAYLSPEEMALLQIGKANNIKQRSKSEDFSIGMTLLSCALLSDSGDCYDFTTKQFHTQLLNRRLHQLNNSTEYSQFFRTIIYGLLSIQAERRFSSREVWAWLKGYEKQIVRKEGFVVEELPLRVNEKLREMKRRYVITKNGMKVGEKSQQSTPERQNSFFDVRQVAKSSEGYYSPRGQQSFRVFIQYKSPVKQITQPYAETTYQKPDERKSPKFSEQTKILIKKSVTVGSIDKQIKNEPKTMQDAPEDGENKERQSMQKVADKGQESPKIIDGTARETSIVDYLVENKDGQKEDGVTGDRKEQQRDGKEVVSSQITEENLTPSEIKDVAMEIVGVSFPVPERTFKVHQKKSEVIELDGGKKQEQQYFSLIEPLVPVKKTVKKKVPPVVLYDTKRQQEDAQQKRKANQEREKEGDFLDEVIEVNKILNEEMLRDNQREAMELIDEREE